MKLFRTHIVSLLVLPLIVGGFVLGLTTSTPLVYAATCNPNSLQTVAYGQDSAAVTDAQACLIQVGYNIPAGATGYYGGQTSNAVTQFYASWYGSWPGTSIGPQGVATLRNRVNSQNSTSQPSSSPSPSSVPNRPTFSYFTASPSSVSAGQSSTLSWSVNNASICNASGGWSGGYAPSGSKSVSQTSSTVYTLTCNGASGGSVSQSVTVTVNGAPVSGLSCQSAPVALGQTTVMKNIGDSYTVNWTSNSLAGSGTCILFKPDGSSSNVPCTSSIVTSQSVPGQYTYRIENISKDSNGNAVTVTSQPATITILGTLTNSVPGAVSPVVSSPVINQWYAQSEGSLPAPVCTMTANPPLVISPANTSKLSWSCNQTISGCSISQGIGPVASVGSISTPVLSNKTTVFTLSCPDAADSSVTVTLSAPKVIEVLPQQ